MASAKGLFKPGVFAGGLFAPGVFRGVGATSSNAIIGQWCNVMLLESPGRIDIGAKMNRIELKAPGRIEVRG